MKHRLATALSSTAPWPRIALAVAVCLTLGTPAAADPALWDGLAACWTYNDGGGTTIADAHNDNDATLTSGTWTSGILGGAMYYNGTSDGAVVSNLSVIPSGSNAVTISTWVQLGTYPSQMTAGFGAIYDSNEDGYVLYADRGNAELRFKVSTVNSQGTYIANARPGVNESLLDLFGWHHLVGVFDGASAWVYFDGQAADMEGLTAPSGMFLTEQHAGMGSEPPKPPTTTEPRYFYTGSIDETAIWNRALSNAEIAYLYNGGSGRSVMEANPTLAPNPMPSPVLHYKFEGNLNNSGTGGSIYNGELRGLTGTASYIEGKDGQGLSLVQVSQNPDDGQHVAVNYRMPDQGTIVFWAKPSSFYDYNEILDNSNSSTVPREDWEMWVYATGVARFRIENDAYVEYDLDNLDGPDHWYQFAISWFRERVSSMGTSTKVGLSMFINGEHVDGDFGTWVDPGNTFSIGGGLTNKAGNNAFDDFQLYDVALTADQIKSLWAPYAQRLPGDANNDGKVDAADAAILAQNWLQDVTGKADDGDFNEDGKVDDLDASILAANWVYTGGGAAVPEPGTLALLAGAAVLLLLRRRRG